jgi:putative oxidoreductase
MNKNPCHSVRNAALGPETLIRWGLAALFISAGLLKLQDPLSFADSIAGFKLLPRLWINPIALCLPPLEIFSALLVLSSHHQQKSLGLTSLLLMTLLFSIALSSALLRGLDVDCGCFGNYSLPFTRNTGFALFRVLLLLAASSYLWVKLFFRPPPV